ncbi:hypothetical protein F5X99DRAFT_399090 [Biscogniauxia marginata]|nr:hypothetical protein F5X99DRAFT_399090 [Biscogniauxia marginata]
MATPSQSLHKESPVQPPSGFFKPRGFTSQQNSVSSNSDSNRVHEPPGILNQNHLIDDIQALEAEAPQPSRKNSLPGNNHNLASNGISTPDRHSRPESAGSTRPQVHPTGSNIKGSFTAKRTNRPERPLPSTLGANRPAKNSSKAARDANSRSAASPEPARVVSDIVGIPAESSPSVSAGTNPASTQVIDQEPDPTRPNGHSSQDTREKSLKRKHRESQHDHTLTSRSQESSPLQPSRGQNQLDGPASAFPEALYTEHLAKKVKSSEAETNNSVRTPMRGIPKSSKSISIKLKPSKTIVPAGPRTVVDTPSNPGSQIDYSAHPSYTSTGDDDTPPIAQVHRRQHSNSHNRRNSFRGVDIANKESSPEPELDNGRNLPRSPEQTRPGSDGTTATNSSASTDEWKYNVFKLPSGQTMTTGGALIPPNYQQHTDPAYSWICPIRDCRTLFKKLLGLGNHFNRLHRGCDLNDNLDGTLTIVKTREGKGVLSSKVVSKIPLDGSEPPMAKPRLPALVALKVAKASEATRGRSQARSKETRLTDTSTSRPSRKIQQAPAKTTIVSVDAAFTPSQGQAKMWEYIHARLKITPKSPIPPLGHIPDLLRLPRLRDIEFNPLAPYPYQEKRVQDIASMIVQATGVEPPRPCSRCREGRGIFKGCYVVSPNAPLLVRQSQTGCANCFYELRQGHCDLRKWHFNTYPELKRQRHPPAQSPAPVSANSPQSEAVKKQRHERRSGRIVLKESHAVASPNCGSSQRLLDTDEDTAAYPSSGKKKEQHYHDHDSTGRHELVRSENVTISNTAESILDPAKMLELEMWEVAPGRIRNEGGEITDNIAFSNSYLSQNQAVRISRDVSFQVITIKPGTAHSFEATAGKLRLCSVASGKAKVKIAGQEFDMGPHGLFKVSPGISATAMNMLYIDVTIHVSVMPGDL